MKINKIKIQTYTATEWKIEKILSIIINIYITQHPICTCSCMNFEVNYLWIFLGLVRSEISL